MCAQTVNAAPKGDIAQALLAWYDRHARDLPWRVRPSAREKDVRADPYRIWLSEIMLQQTTAATVAPRFGEFLGRWPTVSALAAAAAEDVLSQWAGLGYYARARNLHKCARLIANEYDGRFPDTEETLLKLPGIGAYTAAAIAAIAFDRCAVVIDGNVERVMARLFATKTQLPDAKPELKSAASSIWPQGRSGDFAQGLMDLGATVCRPRAPRCGDCPLRGFCAARREGTPEAYPHKAGKKPKPVRRGAAFALFRRDGHVLLERRAEKGLLGGMLGLPTTAWSQEPDVDFIPLAPARADWRHLGEVRHAFTHFHLELEVYAASAARRIGSGREWADPSLVRLPTVMKKALDLVVAAQKEGDEK